MNDLKTGLKLMRYAYAIKTNCIQAAVFLLAGLVLILSGGEGNLVVWGGFFWISISMLPTQLIYTLGVSKLVQASPMRKKLQTVFPVAANFACVTAVYLAELVMCGIRLGVRPDEAGWMGRSLIALAVMMAFMMLYLGACYKYFVAATLFLGPVMVFWLRGGIENWVYAQFLFGGRDVPLGQAAAIGFGILILGALAEYLLVLLFYRAPLSKMAQAVPLRKEL